MQSHKVSRHNQARGPFWLWRFNWSTPKVTAGDESLTQAIQGPTAAGHGLREALKAAVSEPGSDKSTWRTLDVKCKQKLTEDRCWNSMPNGYRPSGDLTACRCSYCHSRLDCQSVYVINTRHVVHSEEQAWRDKKCGQISAHRQVAWPVTLVVFCYCMTLYQLQWLWIAIRFLRMAICDAMG